VGKVVDGIAQPLLPRKRIHLEAEEEEEQTHGRLELPRVFQSLGQEVRTKALKTRVNRDVSPDADIGAGLRQGHGHAVNTPVADEDERGGGEITLPNRDVQLRVESVALP